MIYRSILSLWMLDDTCGDNVTWTKKFNLEADLKINRIFLYLDVEQDFVAKNDIGYIFHDYKTRDISYKFLQQSPAAREWTSVVKYTGSLSSLQVFEKQKEKGKLWLLSNWLLYFRPCENTILLPTTLIQKLSYAYPHLRLLTTDPITLFNRREKLFLYYCRVIF